MAITSLVCAAATETEIHEICADHAHVFCQLVAGRFLQRPQRAKRRIVLCAVR